MGRGDSQQSASSGCETCDTGPDESDTGRARGQGHGGAGSANSGGRVNGAGRFTTPQWGDAAPATTTDDEDERETLVASTSKVPTSRREGDQVALSTPTQMRQLATNKRSRAGKGKSQDFGSRGSIASFASANSSGTESVYEDALSSMDEDEANPLVQLLPLNAQTVVELAQEEAQITPVIPRS
ncbi:hypothetical protein RQP46_006837 [Phenoliferia psychrophenolica]